MLGAGLDLGYVHLDSWALKILGNLRWCSAPAVVGIPFLFCSTTEPGLSFEKSIIPRALDISFAHGWAVRVLSKAENG